MLRGYGVGPLCCELSYVARGNHKSVWISRYTPPCFLNHTPPTPPLETDSGLCSQVSVDLTESWRADQSQIQPYPYSFQFLLFFRFICFYAFKSYLEVLWPGNDASTVGPCFALLRGIPIKNIAQIPSARRPESATGKEKIWNRGTQFFGYFQHVHLLVYGNEDHEIVPRSLQLIAGRTAQAYNRRKKRHGDFWEDRYHATAVDTDEHLIRCMVYIDFHPVKCRKRHCLRQDFTG